MRLRKVMEPGPSDNRRRGWGDPRVGRRRNFRGRERRPNHSGLTITKTPAILKSGRRQTGRLRSDTVVRCHTHGRAMFEKGLENAFPDGEKRKCDGLRAMRGGKLMTRKGGKPFSGEGFSRRDRANVRLVARRKAGIPIERRNFHAAFGGPLTRNFSCAPDVQTQVGDFLEAVGRQ